LFQRFGIKIHFAHRTFKWESEARGKAHVHVVIIGFGAFEGTRKQIYDYDGDKVVATQVANIGPYLVEGTDRAVVSRSQPICAVPEIVYGSKPTDGGHLLIDDVDLSNFLEENPSARKFIHRLIGSEEFINGITRWCLWLKDASPRELRTIEGIRIRVEAVRKFRLASKKEPTREKADEPALFAEIRQPDTAYLLIPSVSSETRIYVPLGFISSDVIANNLVMFVPDATTYHFGILSSAMHMAWMRQVCGRLESRYRYSNKLVYNNFPWPEPTDKQRAAVEKAAQVVLDARKKFSDSTLADLYDPLFMPPVLVKAHAELDRAVDLCYRPQPFDNDRQRVEHLFALYEKLTAPLLPAAKKVRPRRGVRAKSTSAHN